MYLLPLMKKIREKSDEELDDSEDNDEEDDDDRGIDLMDSDNEDEEDFELENEDDRAFIDDESLDEDDDDPAFYRALSQELGDRIPTMEDHENKKEKKRQYLLVKLKVIYN